MELANLINQRKDIFFIDGMAWAQLIPTRYYNSIYLVDCIRTLMNWFDEEWIKEMNQMFYHETKVAFLELS